MNKWLVWIGQLVAAIIAFLQANPVPQQRVLFPRLHARAEMRREFRRASYFPQQPSPAPQARPNCKCPNCNCPNGVCPNCPTQPQAQAAPPQDISTVRVIIRKICDGRQCRAHRYEWRAWRVDPRRHYLYFDGIQIGAWDYDQCEFRSYDAAADFWGHAESEPPVPVPGIEATPEKLGMIEQFTLPPSPGERPAAVPNYGLDLGKMPKHGGDFQYSINGVRCPKSRAYEAMGTDAGRIPNDADAIRITCIGPKASEWAKSIRHDLEMNLPQWRQKVTVQEYASADAPILKGLGFVEGVQLQAPDGKPLEFCAQYDGPEQFDHTLQVADARKKDPNWDPAKWPEMAKEAATPSPAPVTPDPAPAPSPDSKPPRWVWIIAVLLGMIVKYAHGKIPFSTILAWLQKQLQPVPPPDNAEAIRKAVIEELAKAQASAPKPG